MQIKKLVKYINIILVILAMTFNEGIAIDLAENKYTDIKGIGQEKQFKYGQAMTL